MVARPLDYYRVLGITQDADGSTIRRAYLTLIRQYTPESAPDRFREIGEAYRVLSNPKKRAEYDAEERPPQHVQERLDEMQNLLEQDPARAVKLGKALRQGHGEWRIVRLAYARALLEAGEPQRAAEELEELSLLDPTNALYVKLRGHALLRAGAAQQGVRCLKQAIVLDKSDADAYIGLARHWMEQDLDERALELLDRGIHADGVVDVQDLPLFVEKVLVLAKLRRWDEMQGVVETLKRVVPAGDKDAQSYAAWQFVQLARLFHEFELPHLTKFALDASLELDPTQTELRRVSESLQASAVMHRQFEEIMQDQRVADWIKAYVHAMWDDKRPEHERRAVLGNIGMHAASNRSRVRHEWRSAEERYPDLIGELNESFQGLLGSLTPFAGGRQESASAWVWFVVVGVIIGIARHC